MYVNQQQDTQITVFLVFVVVSLCEVCWCKGHSPRYSKIYTCMKWTSEINILQSYHCGTCGLLFTLIHFVGMPLDFIEGHHRKCYFGNLMCCVRMLLRMLIVMFCGVPTFNILVNMAFFFWALYNSFYLIL